MKLFEQILKEAYEEDEAAYQAARQYAAFARETTDRADKDSLYVRGLNWELWDRCQDRIEDAFKEKGFKLSNEKGLTATKCGFVFKIEILSVKGRSRQKTNTFDYDWKIKQIKKGDPTKAKLVYADMNEIEKVVNECRVKLDNEDLPEINFYDMDDDRFAAEFARDHTTRRKADNSYKYEKMKPGDTMLWIKPNTKKRRYVKIESIDKENQIAVAITGMGKSGKSKIPIWQLDVLRDEDNWW